MPLPGKLIVPGLVKVLLPEGPKFQKEDVIELAPMAITDDVLVKLYGKEQLFAVVALKIECGFGKTVIGVMVVEGQFKLLIKFNVIV